MSMLPVGQGSESASPCAASGYQVEHSLRFRGSQRVLRTFTAAANRNKWTFSAWVKLGDIKKVNAFFSAVVSAGSVEDRLEVYDGTLSHYDGGAGAMAVATAKLQDPTAWYHLVYSYDSANITAADRGIWYINGVRQTNSANKIPQNRNSGMNSVTAHCIGAFASLALYSSAHMAEINFLDNATLKADDFGEFNPCGIWVPKKYTGTYTGNSFHLDFKDGTDLTSLGKDASGLNNNWALNNHSLTNGSDYDWMQDTPTNNYAVINAIQAGRSTLSNANLKATGVRDVPTIIPDSGVWYFELDGAAKTWTPPAAFPAGPGDYNFGQRPWQGAGPAAGQKVLRTSDRPSGAIVTSGTFTGNADADGPFVWLNGNPETMTINGHVVVWGTHADKTAGGFKIRTAAASHNATGNNTYTVTTTGSLFGDLAHSPNTAKGNP
jgi:hypothetical protein